MKTSQGGSHQQEPVVGIPVTQIPPQAQAVLYAMHQNANPYQRGMIPPNAIYGPPDGVALRETFYADTPAPFVCPHCGQSGVTRVTSKPSWAACIACMVSLVGVCFLCKGCDCLWHKQHHCPNCGEKVADYRKADPCLVMDPSQWQQNSFALPA